MLCFQVDDENILVFIVFSKNENFEYTEYSEMNKPRASFQSPIDGRSVLVFGNQNMDPK